MTYSLILLTVFCCCSVLGISSNKVLAVSTNPSTTNIFLGKLISEKLSHCSLFFLQDRFDSSETLNYIVRETNLNYYNIKYDYPSHSELELINFKLQKYHMFDLNSTQTLPVRFRISVANYNKRNDPCKVVIMMITDLRPEFIQQIDKMINPVYIPITQKDTDYFVLITQPRLMDKLLLMPELPGRIKFKIAVGDRNFQGGVVVKTACFFCGHGGTPEIIEYPDTGIPNYFPDFVQNLNGKILRVSYPAVAAKIEAFGPPWDGVKNIKRGMLKGFFEEFFMIKFNFTYNMFPSTGKDGSLGSGGTGLELPNGTWIGCVGDVISGKADFAVLTVPTTKRIRHVDFSNGYFDTGHLCLITSEGQRVFSPLALLWPFDILMWFCIFVSTLFAFAIFTFLSNIMDYLGIDTTDALSFARRGVKSKETWGFNHQIFFVLTTYLDQDCVMPRFQPLRCFVALWLFFTLILTTAYRSKLVSLLAFPVIEELPQTFEELVFSDYEVGFIKHGDAGYNTLKASNDPVYVKLLKEMDIITGAGLECLERVANRKYGCIGYDFSMNYLIARNLSDLDIRKFVFAPETTFNIWLGLVYEGRSIYKQNFENWLGYTRSLYLANIWEERDLQYTVRLAKRAWWLASNQTEKLKKTVEEDSSDLTLKHIAGAFYILFACLILCFFVLLYELIVIYKEKLLEKFRILMSWS